MATPIEQEVNGVENMIYMSSRCTNDGQMTLDVTFELGTDLDQAQVLVQNRVAIAEAKLPEEVKRQGVTTKKKSPSILLCINLVSDKEKDPATGKDQYVYDQLFLSNYATINIKDALARIPGVGRRAVPGPARLQHAHLARSAEAGGPQHDGRRRDHGHPQAEPAGRRRPARPTPGSHGPGFSAPAQHPGPARVGGAVPQHRRQDR